MDPHPHGHRRGDGGEREPCCPPTVFGQQGDRAGDCDAQAGAGVDDGLDSVAVPRDDSQCDRVAQWRGRDPGADSGDGDAGGQHDSVGGNRDERGPRRRQGARGDGYGACA